jgi:ribonuclease P protein component
VVFFLSNGLAETRLGLTVPASVGNSVLRNRVKRRVREVFRLNQHSIPAGWDIVVNPRKDAAKVPFATLTRELMRMFPPQAVTCPRPNAGETPGPPESC